MQEGRSCSIGSAHHFAFSITSSRGATCHLPNAAAKRRMVQLRGLAAARRLARLGFAHARKAAAVSLLKMRRGHRATNAWVAHAAGRQESCGGSGLDHAAFGRLKPRRLFVAGHGATARVVA